MSPRNKWGTWVGREPAGSLCLPGSAGSAPATGGGRKARRQARRGEAAGVTAGELPSIRKRAPRGPLAVLGAGRWARTYDQLPAQAQGSGQRPQARPCGHSAGWAQGPEQRPQGPAALSPRPSPASQMHRQRPVPSRQAWAKGASSSGHRSGPEHGQGENPAGLRQRSAGCSPARDRAQEPAAVRPRQQPGRPGLHSSAAGGGRLPAPRPHTPGRPAPSRARLPPCSAPCPARSTRRRRPRCPAGSACCTSGSRHPRRPPAPPAPPPWGAPQTTAGS